MCTQIKKKAFKPIIGHAPVKNSDIFKCHTEQPVFRAAEQETVHKTAANVLHRRHS